MQGKHTAGKRVAEPEYNDGLGFVGKAALTLLITILVVVLGGTAGLGVYANHFYEGVFPGVTIADIPLQGQSLAAAQSTLEQQLDTKFEKTTVTISACGEIIGSFNQRELGVKVHAADAALEAYSVGRKEGFSGWISNAFTMAKAILGGKTDISASLSYDETALQSAVDEMSERFGIESHDAFYELSEDGLYATKEVTGRKLDRDALMEQLRGAQGPIEALWIKIPGHPLDLQAMADEITSEAKPTRYDIELGAVVGGQIGVQVDVEAAQYVMDAAAEGERVRLPAEVVYPQMTAEELEAVLFRDLLSTFTTYVSGSSVRRGNVKLAGEFVNGTILNHGDMFDYNQTVGERTIERGFGEAAAYRNGETVQEVGGGICQTSSTIYCAVLLANLEIVQRANHRFFPGYVDFGMDATVSWGGPEFRFRNDTGYPIRLEVIYKNNNITVNIYGTKTDDTYVVMTNEVLSTTPYNTVYLETMDLPWGTQSTKQTPYTGYKVVTYRNVYDGDGNLISSEVEAKSTYQSRDEIILVGINGRPADGGSSTEPPSGGDTGSDEPTIPDDPQDGAQDDSQSGSQEGSQDSGDSQDGSQEEDSGTIDPEDEEMPDWLKPKP